MCNNLVMIRQVRNKRSIRAEYINPQYIWTLLTHYGNFKRNNYLACMPESDQEWGECVRNMECTLIEYMQPLTYCYDTDI